MSSGGDPARGRRIARRAAILWGVLLLIVTSWPSPPEVPVVSAIPNFDKMVHAFLYAVEGFLLCRSVAWRRLSRSAWLPALAIGGVLAVWGTLDEIHQHWIPGRSMEALDALADTAGGFVGALAAWSLTRRRASTRGRGVRATS